MLIRFAQPPHFPLNERILQGVVYLEHNAVDGCSIAREPWRSKLIRTGYDASLKRIGSACAFYARGGAKVYAQGLVAALNHKARSNPFRLKGDNE